MSKIKVAIIQAIIPHYRVPVFNTLAEQENIDLTLIHSGTSINHTERRFKENILIEKKLLGIFLIKNIKICT